MANVLTLVRDYLRGEDLKVRIPDPAPPPPEVKQVVTPVWTTDTYPGRYPDAFGGAYWNPVPSAPLGGTTGTFNSAVFACIALKAKAFQEAPLRIFRFQGDGTEEWLDNHPFMELVADPHPSLSQPEVNFWLSTCLDTAGEAFLRKIRNRVGQVTQLWPLSPMTVTPETTEEDRRRGVFISHYVVDDGKDSREELPVADVIHFRNGVDDADHRRGMSPLRRLLREVASDEEATRFLEDLLHNFAVASLAVTVPPGPVLTEEQAKQIRDRLREDYGGAARNRGHIAVVANGATLSQVGFTPQQLDLKTAHYIPESRICAVLGVPAMLVGFSVGLEHTIYNNMEQAQEHLYEQTIIPLWRQVAATYTKQLLRPDYTADRSIRLRYDLMDVRALQEDENEKWARLSVAVEKQWITKDEARAEVGLDPLPNGLGEAQDPIEQARKLTEATGTNRPGAEDEEEEEGPPERRALTALEQKAGPPAGRSPERGAGQRGLAYVPELLTVLQQLTVPLVQQDLEAYFSGQAERVLSKAKGG
jgi:HK97 family phage portal protein